MEATATGVFRILDKASDPIKKITGNAKTMDASVSSAGKALDSIDSPQVTRSLKTTQQNVQGLEKTVTHTGKSVEKMTDSAGRQFKKMAAEGTTSIETLTTALKKFEHERATATMDVDIAKAEAKIRLLKQEIRSFTTVQAQKELGDLGLIANKATAALVGSAGGGGGGPPGGGGIRGGLAGGFFATGGRMAFMASAALAAAPAIVALTGAVSALIGSLGAAAGGAGALGIGTIGALAVGMGTIIAVAKPAQKAIKEVATAQDAYNKSIQQYGRDSAQAAEAERALIAIRKKNPGAATVVKNRRVVAARWNKSTAGAREDYFGILNEGLRTVNDLLPTFSRIANRSMKAARNAVEDFLQPFRGAEWKNIFEAMGDTFAKISGPAMRSLGNLAMWFGRIARAASPQVVAAFRSLERWTGSLSKGVGDQRRTEGTISRLVGHFKSWVKLGGSAVRLMGAFFGAGATQGKSVVESITEQFDKWTVWLQDNPGAVEDFFSRTIEAAGKLVTALGQIAKALAQIADAMLPLLNLFSDLMNLVGGAGALEPLMLLGAGRLAFGGRKGGGGGGGMFGRGAKPVPGGPGGGVTPLVTGNPLAPAGGGGLRGRFSAAKSLGAGGIAKGALRGAGRAAWPLAAAMGAWDFASFRGNIAERGQAALSGATLGLIKKPKTGAMRAEEGAQRAQAWFGEGRSTKALGGQVGHLERLLKATNTRSTPVRDARGNITSRVTQTSSKLDKGAKRDVQAQLDALRPILRAQLKVEQTNKAMRGMEDLTRAFEMRWKKSGAAAAGKGLISGIRRQMAMLKPDGQRSMLQATAAWTATMETGSRAQRRIAVRTKREVVAQYDALGRDVRVIEGRIVDISVGKWGSIRKAITTETERARQEGTKAFTELQRAAVGALKNLGFSTGDARELISDMEKGGTTKKLADLQVKGVENTNATIEKVTGGAHKGNAQPKGDGIGVVNDLIGGGSRGPQGLPGAGGAGGGLMGANPGLGVYAQDAAGYGLRVTSGFRGGSITSSGNKSHHASGNALDVAGSPDAMMRFARHAASKYGNRLEELIYTPMGFAIKNGQRVAPYAQKDHFDHVHIADTAPGGLGGGGVGAGGGGAAAALGGGASPKVKLPRKKSKAKGLAGAASNRVTEIIAGAMETKLNAAMGGGLGGGGGPAGGPGAMGFNAVAAIAQSVGLPGITFAQIARGESALKPRAVGNDPGGTKGYGLWQITTGFNDDIIKRFGGIQAMFNPRQNALAAKAIYDRQGIGAWYGTKFVTDRNAQYTGDGAGAGPIREPQWGGWHAKGGAFTAHRPTLIGVGEGGAERVSIRPQAAAGTGKRGTIKINIGKIINHEPGDIEKILDREFKKLARDFDFNIDSDDEMS